MAQRIALLLFVRLHNAMHFVTFDSHIFSDSLSFSELALSIINSDNFWTEWG
jgi:hypothetical protein